MAPQKPWFSHENEDFILSTGREKGVKEILCDGYYYDVTDFVAKHPGGTIIYYYVNNGEDATHAIQQFHQRSKAKVSNLLKSLKRRPANLEDVDPKKLKKHQALSADFTKLYLELEKEGKFAPCYSHNVYRIVEIFALALIAYWLLQKSSSLVKLFGCFLLGLAQGRTGWIQHEAGHNSLTGVPKWDKRIQAVVYGVGIGFSSTWWIRRHNRHHAMPQRINHDIDLETMPLVAYNVKVINNPNEGKTFFVRNQAYLWMTLDTLLAFLRWQLYLIPKYIIRKGHWFEGLCVLGHYLFHYWYGFWPWLLSTWFLSMYLIGNFALSHTHLPITTEPTHWVEYSLLHTANVESGFCGWVDWWMGYLNYQIEHHLFPTMPQFRHPQIRQRVEELAKKHGIPYYVFTYKEAVIETYSNLAKVAKDLQEHKT